MRGFNIGDYLTTIDGKHTGKVVRIEGVIIDGEILDYNVVILENNVEITAPISHFIIV